MAIFLTGFMGTGKSTVGRSLAKRLGLRFVDLDVEIERRAGRTISAIFADAGEERFREMEADALRAVAPCDAVVATGGGAIVAADNRATMRAAGPIICLTARIEELVRRTAKDSKRPLLVGDDVESRVRRLLAARAEAYAEADLQIDTTGVPVAKVVRRIMDYLEAGGRGAERQDATREADER